MILRLRTKHLRFAYVFDSGHQLVGTVEGDYFPNSPNIVFNLRSLKAICCSPAGDLIMAFDDVYGQLDLKISQIIFSASQSEQGSFFSFNCRNGEATIYDAQNDAWIATGWNPANWQVKELSQPVLKTSRSKSKSVALAKRAIA